LVGDVSGLVQLANVGCLTDAIGHDELLHEVGIKIENGCISSGKSPGIL
jgi:hypothetical protein